MQMEPRLMSLPSLSFPPRCSLPSLVCFLSLGVSPLPLLCRCRNTSKLSIGKGLSCSQSSVLDPLNCVQREIAVVLIIVVKFLLADNFLCEVLLL